jgi:hypothetical protein
MEVMSDHFTQTRKKVSRDVTAVAQETDGANLWCRRQSVKKPRRLQTDYGKIGIFFQIVSVGPSCRPIPLMPGGKRGETKRLCPH